MSDTIFTPPKSSQLIKLLLTSATAIIFLWLAFKGVDFSEMLAHSQEVSPSPVLLVGISVLMGTFLRSYRWTLLMQPLRTNSEQPIGQFNAFYAVLMGYAVKAALAILLGLTLFFLPNEMLTSMPGLVTGGMVLIVVASAGLCLLPHMGNITAKCLELGFVKRHLSANFGAKLSELAVQFDQGSGSLRSFARFPYIALLSMLIWFTYWLNFYLMVFAFELQDKINAIKCLIIFTIGSVGSLIPTPGSIGSIHYLVKMAAIKTAQISAEQAMTFATISHLFIFIIFPGLIAASVFLCKRIR